MCSYVRSRGDRIRRRTRDPAVGEIQDNLTVPFGQAEYERRMGREMRDAGCKSKLKSYTRA